MSFDLGLNVSIEITVTCVVHIELVEVLLVTAILVTEGVCVIVI